MWIQLHATQLHKRGADIYTIFTEKTTKIQNYIEISYIYSQIMSQFYQKASPVAYESQTQNTGEKIEEKKEKKYKKRGII